MHLRASVLFFLSIEPDELAIRHQADRFFKFDARWLCSQRQRQNHILEFACLP